MYFKQKVQNFQFCKLPLNLSFKVFFVKRYSLDMTNFLTNSIFLQNSTIAIQIHVWMEHVWIRTIHIFALVFMAIEGLIVMVISILLEISFIFNVNSICL